MSVILLILGLLIAAAGIATTFYGIAISEFTLGPTLIIAGTTALTGGLILIGLSAVVTELGRVTEGLKTRVARAAGRALETQEPVVQPVAQQAAQAAPPAIASPAPAAAASARPAQANVPAPLRAMPQAPMREARPPEPRPPESHPAAPSAVEVSAAAIERLRSSIPRERSRPESPVVADVEGVPLSPNGAHHQAAPQRPSRVEAAPEPKVSAQERAGGAGVEAKGSRLDFLFRAKAARPAPQAENFETIWPGEARPASDTPAEPAPQPRYDQIERRSDYPAPVQNRRAEPPPDDEPHAATILKSGVVDGMAYTLYSDGSIEAKLPNGTVRFGSIAELRAHIENNA
jgi:hypothetical protein